MLCKEHKCTAPAAKESYFCRCIHNINNIKSSSDFSDGIYREYYMVAKKYEIYFECEQDISRVSAANECDVLFKTRNKFHIF